MTAFEVAYSYAEPLLPPLYRSVRRRLLAFAHQSKSSVPEILDVGGRKSHYTIGVPARITVTELPRRSAIQEELNLGLTAPMIAVTQIRRSNIASILFDDMTDSVLPEAAFDCVVAVEVLEHVERDRAFLKNVHRVLRPGGMFLMTTPNGDSIPIPNNPDHRRHYPRRALENLLKEIFSEVIVEYAIADSRARGLGLRSWSTRHPLRTIASMVGNVVNSVQSTAPGIQNRAVGTRHLIATARRAS